MSSSGQELVSYYRGATLLQGVISVTALAKRSKSEL